MAAGAGSPRLLALILLGILAVRLVALWLAQTDLFFDEAQYWSWAKELDLGYYSKPPLIAWVIAATTAVCGDGEPCVRLAAPVLHTVSAWIVHLIGCRLYDARIGFWSGIVFATLPGIGLSSGIISTDVPFLLCWALALWGFVRLRETGNLGDALLLGAAIGAGFMARYSMVFFVGSTLLALVTMRGSGARIGAARWIAVALVALLVVSPNLYWNAAHGFPTFGHTADNAKWGGSLFHPLKALEFFGAQFGVFGPVLFGALLVIVWRAVKLRTSGRGETHPPPQPSPRGGGGSTAVYVARDDLSSCDTVSPSRANTIEIGLTPTSPPPRGEGQGGGRTSSTAATASPPPQAPKSKALGPYPQGGREESRELNAGQDRILLNADRLLLCFVLPILLIYIAQAFVSRAHANWAAAGYVAATVLVVATMFRDGARRAFRVSLGMHAVLTVVIAFSPLLAGRRPFTVENDPFRRMLGWREMADRVRSEVKSAASQGKPYAAILIDDRGTLAEHLYYLRDLDTPILAWRSGPVPKDHYELTRPYDGRAPALLVSQDDKLRGVLDDFQSKELRLTHRSGSYVGRDWRPTNLYRLDGFIPKP